MSTPIHRHIVGIARIDTHHAAFRIAVAEEGRRRRRELTELPTVIEPLKHREQEGTLEIRTRGQWARLEDTAMHAAHDIPARVGGRFEGIVSLAAPGHECHGTGAARARSTQ